MPNFIEPVEVVSNLNWLDEISKQRVNSCMRTFHQYVISESFNYVIDNLSKLMQMIQGGNFTYPQWRDAYRDLESSAKMARNDSLLDLVYGISSEYETHNQATPHMMQLMQQASQMAQQLQSSKRSVFDDDDE